MGLLKRLANLIRGKRREIPEIASTDIVGYDTSKVIIPEYRSLNPEDKAAVDKYVEETKIEKIDDVITYGRGISKYSEGITELLLSTLYTTTEGIPELDLRNMPKEEIVKARIEAMVAEDSIRYYQAALSNLDRETKLRTVALKEIYKKQNNVFRRIFNPFNSSRQEKAEKVQKQFENGRYEYAIEGMKISKKIIEQQIQATLNAGASLRNNRPSNSRV